MPDEVPWLCAEGREKLGIKKDDEGIWLVSFMHDDLGYFDLEQKANRPGQPVRRAVVTHVLGTFCDLCVRAGHSGRWCRKRDSNPRPRHYE